MKNLYRFVEAPEGGVAGIRTRAGLVEKNGIIELTDDEAQRVAPQNNMEQVDEGDLTDEEKETVITLPEEDPEAREQASKPDHPTEELSQEQNAHDQTQPPAETGATTAWSSQGGGS